MVATLVVEGEQYAVRTRRGRLVPVTVVGSAGERIGSSRGRPALVKLFRVVVDRTGRTRVVSARRLVARLSRRSVRDTSFARRWRFGT